MDIIITSGVVIGAFSFTTGFVSRKDTTRPTSEKDVWAQALWLNRHGQCDEAEELIDRWCASYLAPPVPVGNVLSLEEYFPPPYSVHDFDCGLIGFDWHRVPVGVCDGNT